MGELSFGYGRQGDLPSLLDTLTVAVTTLDAVGVENYNELYLYVVGTTGDEVVRDLRVENGHLIVGPPADRVSFPNFLDYDFEENRRALLLADLCYIMRIWRWSAEMMAGYLRCSEVMLSTWIGRSAGVDIPIVPHAIIERIKRLSMIEQARYIMGITDAQIPGWLGARRPAFMQRSVQDILQEGHACEFNQVLIWALNKSGQSETVH